MNEHIETESEKNKFARFAAVHGLYKDFWNWCANNHPEVHKEFVEIIRDNDKLLNTIFHIKEKRGQDGQDNEHC